MGSSITRQGSGRYTSLVICNYARSGNWMGKPVYKSGYACSACPPGHRVCKDGLCAREEGRAWEEDDNRRMYLQTDNHYMPWSKLLATVPAKSTVFQFV